MEALPTPILVLSQGLRCSLGSMTFEQECQGRASPCIHCEPGKKFKKNYAFGNFALSADMGALYAAVQVLLCTQAALCKHAVYASCSGTLTFLA